LELAPQRVGIRLMLSLVLFALGRVEEALAEAEAESEGWARLAAQAIVRALAGDRAGSMTALWRLHESHAEANAFQIAMAHAARGEVGAAFTWLERACAQRDPGVSWTRIEPLFAGLREDGRYWELVRKTGLEG